MPKGHDFKKFPELTNSQMQFYYWESPHKQITEDFRAKVVKVSDGDTVRVEWQERDFDFPIRIFNLAAPELREKGGIESQRWLESEILGEEVEIIISETRVEKWGRLLADIFHRGMLISEESVRNFHGVPWEQRDQQGILPNFRAELENLI